MITPGIEKAFHQFLDLEPIERDAYLSLLCQQFRVVLSDNRAECSKPWNDRREGFGPVQSRLLDFLDAAADPVATVAVARHLWGRELAPLRDGSDDFEAKLASLLTRLRVLKQTTNHKLLVAGYGWTIARPRTGFLAFKAVSICVSRTTYVDRHPVKLAA